jgi:outer membrane immunogenic protein
MDSRDELRSPSLPTSPAAPIIVVPSPSTLFVLQLLGTIRCPEKPQAAHTDADNTVVQFNPIQFGANAPGTLRNTLRQEMDYFATIRGRAGIAFDRVLVYATGGAAMADIENTADFSSPRLGPTQFFGQRSETQVGYTVGGGVEFALPAGFLLGSAATFKTEYLYYDVGKTSVAVLPTATGVPLGVGGYVSRFENEGHIVRGGINFKFGTF